MTNQQSTAAESVSRTVWVLAQLRGITSKQELANVMGWDRTRLSRTLSGARQWTLEDLVVAADALGLASAGELFRPLAELVGAVHPAASGSPRAVGERPQLQYRADDVAVIAGEKQTLLGFSGGTIIPFPVGASTPPTALTRPARVITLSRNRRIRTTAPLSDTSSGSVTGVTAAGGI